MTPQELKNSILQLAIQGKLVEQHPEEGTAEALYRQIQEEKKRLIKEGKIKKEKPLPEIAEDEKPFEIPESWMWVRFGNVISLVSGTDFKPEEYNDQGRGTIYITGASNLSDNGVIISRWTEAPRNFAYRGDILLVCKGSGYGKTVFCDIDEAHIARQIMAIKRMDTLNMSFIRYFLQANIYYLKTKGQGVIPGIDRVSVLNMLLPIPPIEEQKRIVAKIEELLPYIDRYEQAWNRLEEFNNRFPVNVRKSLLQWAIQGKLVEQRPEEGTAEELYRQIQEEKRRLVKEGKIKKEKPLPEIAEDEVPFEIPGNWIWCRLGNILYKLTDGTHSTPKYTASGVPFLSVKDMSSGQLDFSSCKYISEQEHQELFSRCNPEYGDLLLTKIGTTGIPVIVNTDKQFSLFVSVALLKFCQDLIDNKFLQILLNSPLVQTQATENTRGVGNKNWVMRDIANTLIVLPPLAEQKRIVAKLEELLPLCERLK